MWWSFAIASLSSLSSIPYSIFPLGSKSFYCRIAVGWDSLTEGFQSTDRERSNSILPILIPLVGYNPAQDTGIQSGVLAYHLQPHGFFFFFLLSHHHVFFFGWFSFLPLKNPNRSIDGLKTKEKIVSALGGFLSSTILPPGSSSLDNKPNER